VGVATYLFFQNIKNLIFLMIMLATIYSGYTLFVNVLEPSSQLSFDNFPKKLSFASTVQNLATNSGLYNSLLIEGWLIVATIIIWWIGLLIMKHT
jgi:uncharacterized membrane protein